MKKTHAAVVILACLIGFVSCKADNSVTTPPAERNYPEDHIRKMHKEERVVSEDENAETELQRNKKIDQLVDKAIRRIQDATDRAITNIENATDRAIRDIDAAGDRANKRIRPHPTN